MLSLVPLFDAELAAVCSGWSGALIVMTTVMIFWDKNLQVSILFCNFVGRNKRQL